MSGTVSYPDFGHLPSSVEQFTSLCRDAVHQKSIRCPCAHKSEGDGAAQENCANCRGFGYAFVNPKRVPVLVKHLEMDEKIMAGGEQDSGTCLITGLSESGWAKHDIVIFSDCSHEYTSDLVHFTKREGSGDILVAYTHYSIRTVEAVMLWRGVQTPYQFIPKTDYTVDGGAFSIMLDGKYSHEEEIFATVRYGYNPVFEIIEFERAADSRPVKDEPSLDNEHIALFVLMRARRAFYEKKVANLHNGSKPLINDYPDISQEYTYG